ncbi:MAG: hypothetical protein SWZ49_07630 [Cyanobacteriota bacterium]|nr:hypothetical protein [Cyanobacteriota bacterium]
MELALLGLPYWRWILLLAIALLLVLVLFPLASDSQARPLPSPSSLYRSSSKASNTLCASSWQSQNNHNQMKYN